MTTAWTVVGQLVHTFRRCGQREGILRRSPTAYSVIPTGIKTSADIKAPVDTKPGVASARVGLLVLTHGVETAPTVGGEDRPGQAATGF